jgi:hypothetical protein
VCSVTLGGVPFNIRSNAAGFQAWNGYVASRGKDGTVSLTIPVNVHRATDVYTVINTYWAAAGSSHTALVFAGSGGATYTDHLFVDSDIRGWCCVGSINGTSTVNVFKLSSSPIDGAQGFLDMQHIVLPPVFATQTLTSIQVVDSGATSVQRTVLDSVTVLSAAAAGTTPTLAESYTGSARNVTAAESAPITLSGVTQNRGTISGTFTFHAPLAGTGPFMGTISSSIMRFEVKPTAASCALCSNIIFTGSVSRLVSLSGTWVAHLKSGSSQNGTWGVGCTWNGPYDDTSQNVPGTMSLTDVTENAKGAIAAAAIFTSRLGRGTGPLTGSVQGQVVKFLVRCNCGTFTFTGNVSTALGSMSGTYNGPVDGTWQVRRSGAADTAV